MEYPECFTETWRVARKEHRCCECHSPIPRGIRYQYCSGVWDGEPADYKTCQPCAEIRKDMDAYLARSSVSGNPVPFESLREYCSETVEWSERWNDRHVARKIAPVAA